MTKSILLALSASALLFTVACGDDDPATTTTTASTTTTTTGEGGSTTTGMGGSTSSGMGGSGGAMPEMGAVRVAHLSPDAPAVDFCVSPDAGTTWVGPVAENILMAADGLPYSGVTDYIPLQAATYSVRIVANDATDCNTEIATFDDITLPAGVQATIAATGYLSPPMDNKNAFTLTVYVDDNSAPAAGKGKLRFIHASANTPAVDVGLGSGASFTPVFTNQEFPKASDYLEVDPLDKVTISARATGTNSDALVLEGVSLPAGAVATAFAIGNLGNSPKPLKALICVDNAEKSTCSVLPAD